MIKWRCRRSSSFVAVLLALAVLAVRHCRALFQEEAGQLDFLVSSAGHGATRFVHCATRDRDDDSCSSVVTSDGWTEASASEKSTTTTTTTSTSCYIASRRVTDGKLLWRRNVCSDQYRGEERQGHAVAAVVGGDNDDRVVVVTYEASGTVRAWNADTGALVWDVHLGNADDDTAATRSLWTVTTENGKNHVVVATTGGGAVTVLDATDGSVVESNDDDGTFARRPPTSAATAGTPLKVTCGGAADSDGEISIEFKPATKTFRAFRGGGRDAPPLQTTSDFALSPDDEVTSLTLLDCSGAAQEGRVAVVLVATARGTTAQVTFTIQNIDGGGDDGDDVSVSGTTVWSAEEGLSRVSSALLLDASHVVSNLRDGGEEGGEASFVDHLSFFSRLRSQYRALTDRIAVLPVWSTAADGGGGGGLVGSDSGRDHFFGFVKIAVLLSGGSSHRVFGLDTIDEGGSTTGADDDDDEHYHHRRRGRIRYRIDLPRTASWHKLVHGATNAPKASHGINGGTHAKDVLVVSYSPLGPAGDGEEAASSSRGGIVSWVCLDGTQGAVHAEGKIAVPSGVRQVVPLAVAHTAAAGGSSSSSCRQGAMLVLRDRSVALVPGDEGTRSAAQNQLRASENGFYTHLIHSGGGNADETGDSPTSSTAGLESLRLSAADFAAAADGKMIRSDVVGSVAFPGERVVAAGYPARDEVVQSPCNVLGDESLLLKYLNPHLAVIVTMKSSDDKNNDAAAAGVAASNENKFAEALAAAKRQQQQKQKRKKPVGATPTTTTTTPETTDASPSSSTTTTTTTTAAAEEEPNLFVNVIDSVSGRIIYRTSHAHAAMYPAPTVLVSENWIFYTFVNRKTRRAELGVLSLYEGMVDNKGLTAFTTTHPGTTSFSSLVARESKPVVLAKTYSLAGPAVTATGITETRGGISGRRLLLATLDGRISQVDRKMLEPRRPAGPLKEAEKKEGLRQYSELIPTVSYLVLSYNLTVEGARIVLTAPTDLESQTVALVAGGPDIFYSRASPSRGFDLLPDSFNRPLLSLVVIGLVIATLVVRNAALKKIRKQGWV